MEDSMTDVKMAETVLKEFGMSIHYDVIPRYSLTPCKVSGAFTHPILADYNNNTTIFVYFHPNIGYQIYNITGMNSNGFLLINREIARSTFIVPGRPGWKEKLRKHIEQIRHIMSEYYITRKNKETEYILSLL